ncbi:MAG: hypothetical protein EOP21_00570 [Hyphomicrobiales bacterium]|nr:MAG: hypothetical protein EOP21_00570 [Hyphomicrobiales bacterium]
MSAHPVAFRQRIVDACARGEASIRALARIFDLSTTTAQRYLRRLDLLGSGAIYRSTANSRRVVVGLRISRTNRQYRQIYADGRA